MFKYLRQHPDYLLLSLLGLWTILNLVTANMCELNYTEAYYWHLSNNLEWGYSDCLPLTPFLIDIGTEFFGKSEIGVRLFSAFLLPLSLFIFWKTIRNKKSTHQSALTYFGLCFSIPMLHLWGFMATSSALFMLAIAITLWALKSFTTAKPGFNDGYILSIFYLAGGLTLMAYSNYLSILVVLAIVISHLKLLRDWRFYISLSLFALLYYPHIEWLTTNSSDTLSSIFISEIDGFKLYNLWGYIAAFVIFYNPFFAIPLYKTLFSRSPFVQNPMERLMRLMGTITLASLLVCVIYNHIEPQWMLPMFFPMAFFLLRRSERSHPSRLYILSSSIFFGLLLLALQIMVIYTEQPILRALDFQGKELTLQRAALTTKENNVELFVSDGKYYTSSLLNFYTTLPSYSTASIYTDHKNHWDTNQLNGFHSKRVAIELNKAICDSCKIDSLKEIYQTLDLGRIGTHLYLIADNYTPTEDIKIEMQSFPQKIITGQRLALTFKIENPYPYSIAIGGDNGYSLILHFGSADNSEQHVDVHLKFISQEIMANSSTSVATTFTIPELPTGKYISGVTIQKQGTTSSYNSKAYDLLIVNPKSRI